MDAYTPPGYQRIEVHVSQYGSDKPVDAVWLGLRPGEAREVDDSEGLLDARIRNGWAVPVGDLIRG